MTNSHVAAPPSPPDIRTRLAWRKWAVAALVVTAAIVVFVNFDVRALLRDALDAIARLGVWAPVLFILVYIVAAVFFVPGSALTLGAGALFGVVWGSIYVSAGATLGATAAFLVGRYLAREWVAKKIEDNAKFAAIDQAVTRQGWKIVGLTRLSPVFPFTLLNYAFGLTHVKLRDYVLASWIGMMPGTVMYVYIGSLARAAGEKKSPVEWALDGVGLAATIIVTVFITRIARFSLRENLESTNENIGVRKPEAKGFAEQKPPLQPWDAHNQRLYGHVHPPAWRNPDPAPRYNLVVIGGGTAGLVTAVGAAGLGAKVALVERHLLGGDCLNVGCVPSKALIRAARAAADARRAGEFGVNVGGDVSVDFPAVMERMRRLRADISPHDSAARLRDSGVDVFIGNATFTGPDTVMVGESGMGVSPMNHGRPVRRTQGPEPVEGDARATTALRFAKAVIATGARAAAPAIPGLKEVCYLTNETVFSLTQLPKRLGVIGAGPIGCELAQAFARFGSEVFLVEAEHGIMPRENRDAAELVLRAMTHDGVMLLCCGKNLQVAHSANGIRLQVDSHGKGYDETVDQLLVAVGRAPNVEGLGLENVGVEYDKKGVKVNDQLQTANPRIFACGDICSPYQFTHAADFMARIVIQNALFKGRAKASALNIPWATYTSPEVAHVGLYEKQAKEKGIDVDTFTQELAKVDRAILDGETDGFVRVHVRKGTDEIVGATIIAAHAGDLISEPTLAMNGKLGLKTIGAAIHPYPTQAEAIRKVGDLYSRTRLTPFVKKLMGKWLAWQRGGP